MGRGVYSYYKGHRDGLKGEGRGGGEVGGFGWGGVGWRNGEKMQTTVIEQQ